MLGSFKLEKLGFYGFGLFMNWEWELRGFCLGERFTDKETFNIN